MRVNSGTQKEEKMQNQFLRNYAKEKHIKMWQLADALGIAESTLCRRLRYEISERNRDVYIHAIDKVAQSLNDQYGGDNMP